MKPIKRELFITGQQLRFSRTPQVDPEGQAAVREFRVEAPAGYQAQNQGAAGLANQQGSIPAIIQYGTTAGEMAQGRRSACQACRHWDNAAWRKFITMSTGPLARAEDKQTLESLRNTLTLRGIQYDHPNGKPMTIDEIVAAHGICRVLSDWVEGVVGRDPLHWPVVPGPDANCPPSCHAGASKIDVATPAAPLGFFQPRDLDSVKIGDKRYDEVLRLAQGKTVTK